jgi:hypothetical protein
MTENYQAEPEIHHVGRDLAAWSQQHIAELENRYGLDSTPDPGPIATIWETVGGTLLDDLRALHLTTARVSLDWELLGQGAQATKDNDLLALTTRCHPETLRQQRWANAMLKTLSPQALIS